MSVEEARLNLRKETVEAVAVGQMRPSWYAAIGRLILEVRAEMPCSQASHSMTCLDWLAESEKGLEYVAQSLCESCQAKADLAEPKTQEVTA